MRAVVNFGISVLFVIAAVGVLGCNLHPLDGFGIALALTLLCVDQGRMALVDLDNIRQIVLDERVRQLWLITLITIVIELIGFYLAWLWLGWGTALVLLSQLFFNTTAKIQLYPGSLEPIKPFGLRNRIPVLIANTVALGLVVLWQADQIRSIAAGLLLAMVLVYIAFKYWGANPAVAEKD